MSILHAKLRRSALALAASTLCATALLVPQRQSQSSELRPADRAAGFDPALDTAAFCGPARGGPPPLLKGLIRVKTETAPFQPASVKAASGEVPLYRDLGTLHFKVSTASAQAQANSTRGCGWPSASTTPRRSARCGRRRRSTRSARPASGPRR